MSGTPIGTIAGAAGKGVGLLARGAAGLGRTFEHELLGVWPGAPQPGSAPTDPNQPDHHVRDRLIAFLAGGPKGLLDEMRLQQQLEEQRRKAMQGQPPSSGPGAAEPPPPPMNLTPL
jgi:hypothetical protein